MLEVLCLLIGLLVGGGVAWLWASARARASFATQFADVQAKAAAAESIAAEVRAQAARAEQALTQSRRELDAERAIRVQAETRAAETARNLDEQRKLLDEAKARLAEAFQALSGEALKSNNQAFVELAKSTLQAVLEQARGDLGKRQEAIDGLVKPLAESLKRYEEHIKALEESRQKAYGALDEQLRTLAGTQQQLQTETGKLVTALRAPQVRGRWGEITLRRVVELAGLSDHCDYEEQVSVETEGQRRKPDMIVHLPGDRDIVVDAKAPLMAYLDALSAETEEQRKECLRRHAQQLRVHMQALASKAYWDQFPRAPEFVVLFIPGESFFAAAVDEDHSLIQDGMEKRVILATPTTLLALLRAVAYGWRQEQIAKSAAEVSELGRQLYDRVRIFTEHLADVGRHLGRTNEAYNKAVASLESRVLITARRFKELGAGTSEDIPVAHPVDSAPRLPEA